VVLAVDLEVAGRHHRARGLGRGAVLGPSVTPARVLAVEYEPALVGGVLRGGQAVSVRGPGVTNRRWSKPDGGATLSVKKQRDGSVFTDHLVGVNMPVCILCQQELPRDTEAVCDHFEAEHDFFD
jgi:hypothetical protein